MEDLETPSEGRADIQLYLGYWGQNVAVVSDSFESFMDFVHLQRELKLCTRKTVSSLCCMCWLWSVVRCFNLTTSISDALNWELLYSEQCLCSLQHQPFNSNMCSKHLDHCLSYLLHKHHVLICEIVILFVNMWFYVITDDDIVLSHSPLPFMFFIHSLVIGPLSSYEVIY